jgi:hypothetical protein
LQHYEIHSTKKKFANGTNARRGGIPSKTKRKKSENAGERRDGTLIRNQCKQGQHHHRYLSHHSNEKSDERHPKEPHHRHHHGE